MFTPMIAKGHTPLYIVLHVGTYAIGDDNEWCFTATFVYMMG